MVCGWCCGEDGEFLACSKVDFQVGLQASLRYSDTVLIQQRRVAAHLGNEAKSDTL